MVEDTIDWDAVNEAIVTYHVSELFLAVVGIVAILIVYMYLKDKESAKYKALVVIGVIIGIVMVYLCVTAATSLTTGTTIIVAIAAFSLIIRPFRDVHFSLILSLLVMVVVYVLLGDLTGDWEILATGWYRIGIAFLLGAIVYMITNFIQDLMQLFGKILNAWPLLFVLGMVCIAESICVYLGYGSVYNMIYDLLKESGTLSSISL
ncbi:MAG: hypothetical protein WC248_01460 [Candidatus Methanomethylophilaceae archaeon]|jgi:hypothetical protein